MTSISARAVVIAVAACSAFLIPARNAMAVPSFSRQTGMSCDACHTVAPQLTAFGRFFKMNGYVMSTSVLSPSSGKVIPKESIDAFPPLSAAIRLSDTDVNRTQPGTQNHTVSFPEMVAVYYAGRIASHLGAFMQATYDSQGDHFSMDMTDIRYARRASLAGVPVIWGIDANNQPTFDDVYNSTPSEGFPYAGSPSAPGPSATPMIIAMMQQVAGLGGYAWIDNSVYVNLSLYRSAQIGQSLPLDSTAGCASAGCVISGLSPYWRLSWEHDWSSGNYANSFEVGTFGIDTQVYPNGVSGVTDHYLDAGLDSQYQLLMPGHSSLDVHAMYIHERQVLDASSPAQPDNHVNAWDLNAQYYWHERYGPSIGYFNTSGNANPTLYASTSRTDSPDSNGWILQWTYLPWQNIQLGAQYTLYTRFDGASHNYDGSGRNAADNDTLYLFAWLLW